MLYALCIRLLSSRLLRGSPVESSQDAWLEVDYYDWFGLLAIEVGGSFTVDYRYVTVELSLPLPGRKLAVSLTRCYGAEAFIGRSGFELRFS
jgi:hypothetical protein